MNKVIDTISSATMDACAISVAGNIRELQNVIERSVILCETEIFFDRETVTTAAVSDRTEKRN